MRQIVFTLATVLGLTAPGLATASFFDITRHDHFFNSTRALDFKFGDSFFDPALNPTSGSIFGSELGYLGLRCFSEVKGVHTADEFGPTCPDGSANQVEGGTIFHYTLGTSRGAADLGEFGIQNSGGRGEFYTGTSYPIADRDLKAAPVSFATNDVFLRIWSTGDDFAPTHVLMSLWDPVDERSFLADSAYLGSVSLAPVPLPASGPLLIAGVACFFSSRKRKTANY